jgi:tetratricopeptide (TPR) repeat protein
MDQLNAVLDHYGATRDDAWLNADSVRRLPAHDRAQLLADMGETFFRMADVACLQAIGRSDRAGRDDLMSRAEGWNVAAERLAGDRIPLAVRQQKTAISALRSGRPVPAIDRDGATTARDLALVGGQLAQVGRHRDALAALRQATQLDPSDFSAWFVRGTIHLDLEQNELAAMSFGACLALRPTFAPAWRNRGLAFSKLRFFDQALDDYDRAIALDPLRAESFLQRAAAKDTRGDSGGAEADYTAALTLGSAPVRTYFLRADIRERRGNAAGARADQEEGLRLVPADELSWIGRAEVRVESDPTGALADVHEALKINPASLPGMQLKAHILAERLHRPAEALATLDRAVERYPESASVRAGRGVIRARQGNRTDAVQDAKDALLLDGKAPNLYQVGCIYALTARTNSDDKREALRLLWAGLKTGFGLDIVDTDSDLDSIRSDPEFNRLIERARLLHPGLKK